MNADDTNDRYVTITEMAQRMRVSKMTAYRIVHEKELPSVKFGRSIRVLESDFQAYIRRQTSERPA